MCFQKGSMIFTQTSLHTCAKPSDHLKGQIPERRSMRPAENTGGPGDEGGEAVSRKTNFLLRSPCDRYFPSSSPGRAPLSGTRRGKGSGARLWSAFVCLFHQSLPGAGPVLGHLPPTPVAKAPRRGVSALSLLRFQVGTSGGHFGRRGDGSGGNGQGRPSVGAPCPPLNEIACLPVHRSASWKLLPGHQLLAHQLQARAPAAPGVPGWGGGGGAPVMPTESPGVRENQRRPRERKSHPAQRRGRVTLLPRTGPRGGPREAGGNRAASSRPTVRTRLLAGAAHAPGHQVGV